MQRIYHSFLRRSCHHSRCPGHSASSSRRTSGSGTGTHPLCNSSLCLLKTQNKLVSSMTVLPACFPTQFCRVLRSCLLGTTKRKAYRNYSRRCTFFAQKMISKVGVCDSESWCSLGQLFVQQLIEVRTDQSPENTLFSPLWHAKKKTPGPIFSSRRWPYLMAAPFLVQMYWDQGEKKAVVRRLIRPDFD